MHNAKFSILTFSYILLLTINYEHIWLLYSPHFGQHSSSYCFSSSSSWLKAYGKMYWNIFLIYNSFWILNDVKFLIHTMKSGTLCDDHTWKVCSNMYQKLFFYTNRKYHFLGLITWLFIFIMLSKVTLQYYFTKFPFYAECFCYPYWESPFLLANQIAACRVT